MKRVNEALETLINIPASIIMSEHINTSDFLNLIGFSPIGFSIGY